MTWTAGLLYTGRMSAGMAASATAPPKRIVSIRTVIARGFPREKRIKPFMEGHLKVEPRSATADRGWGGSAPEGADGGDVGFPSGCVGDVKPPGVGPGSTGQLPVLEGAV